jgi:tRNA threonylcarbamoyladenosine biosynthesis protein TsaE
MTRTANTTRVAIISTSPEQTQSIGRALMDLLPDGALVALYGDLGAGKTCFVRGMAQTTGAANLVTSPTFTIVHEYPGQRPIVHIDLYRIAEPRQILDLGYDELFTPPSGVCVVEWADRAAELLPPRRVDVTLMHRDKISRSVEIFDRGVLPGDWSARFSLE